MIFLIVEPDFRTDDRILADKWLILLASAGRRAASKTN
jgi:hypothetical protein